MLIKLLLPLSSLCFEKFLLGILAFLSFPLSNTAQNFHGTLFQSGLMVAKQSVTEFVKWTVIILPHFVYFTLVPDDPPQNICAIGIEPTVLKAYWLPVSNETINGIGLGYKLSLFTTAGTIIRNYTLNSSVLSLEITGLDIWTNYSIRMAAFTIVGDGPWSDLIVEDTDEEGQSAFTSTSLISIQISFNKLEKIYFTEFAVGRLNCAPGIWYSSI